MVLLPPLCPDEDQISHRSLCIKHPAFGAEIREQIISLPLEFTHVANACLRSDLPYLPRRGVQRSVTGLVGRAPLLVTTVCIVSLTSVPSFFLLNKCEIIVIGQAAGQSFI